jgi:hypothetical protein
MVESIRHPTTRGRSVSIGPQSAADAYETLAYRERRRRESMGSNHDESSSDKYQQDYVGKTAQVSGSQQSALREHEQMMSLDGEAVMSPLEQNGKEPFPAVQSGELEEKDVFSQIVKPRVRYDVEVVTKLVVYTGMAPLKLTFYSDTVTNMVFRHCVVCRGVDSPHVRVCGTRHKCRGGDMTK